MLYVTFKKSSTWIKTIYQKIANSTSAHSAYWTIHFNSHCMLNSHISTRIDNYQFSYLKNIWHIDSEVSNHITQNKTNFSNNHLSFSNQIIWTNRRPMEVKGYGSVLIDWITQTRKWVSVIFTNVLHVLGIIINLISIWKLDCKRYLLAFRWSDITYYQNSWRSRRFKNCQRSLYYYNGFTKRYFFI